MKTIFILTILTIMGFYLSKVALYIIDETCYLIIGFGISYGNERIQKIISKLLGV